MAMVEQGVYANRTSNERKRTFARGEARDAEAKRRTVDASVASGSQAGYGGAQIPSYPVSSLHHSPYHRDAEISNGSYPGHSRSLSGQCTGLVASTHALARSGYPSFDSSLAEEGYPEQYDHFRDYPLTQPPAPGDDRRRNEALETGFPPMPSYSSPQTKRNNRFNLSRYQLDEDADVFASIPAVDDEKPNRFKTQRERLMLATRSQDSEEDESASTAPGFDERCLSSDAQSQSQDSYVSQRERLRRFSSEQSRHVVIPNEWEGEQRLQEFVAFGNIEAALRPLGLMMARAALVSDSVTTRHRRSSSTEPSCRHTSLSNQRTS